jgi:CRISPR-associated protein Cas2
VVVGVFVIITYDVGEKRVGKVCKKLRKYLDWTQNSVFEGEITKGKLDQCLAELANIIHKDKDSIYLYQVSNPKNIKKIVHGQEKSPIDIFL